MNCRTLGMSKHWFLICPPDYAFVQEYECKYKNPKLTLYRLADGSTEIVKVKTQEI